MTQVLKLPAFRRLLIAYGLTEFAWTIVSLALAVLVYRRTGSALGAAGFFICAQFVPAFFSPAVVARLDRRAPGPTLSALYVLETGLFLLLAWLINHLSLGWVLWLAMVDGIIALVVRSLARATSVGVTAPLGLLREGNALTNTVFSVCLLAAPALGGLIVAIGNVRLALFVASGMVMLVGLALATARGLPEAVPQDASPPLRRLRAAVQYVRGEEGIRRLFVIQAIGLVFFTMSIPVEVVLAQNTLHAGAGGYGALLTAWGGGAIAGSVVFARWRSRRVWILMALGATFVAVGLLGMAVAPSLFVAVFGAAVAGVGNGIEVVAARTMLQEQVQVRWLAIVTSLDESMVRALPGIGILLGGVLAEYGSARIALAVAGVGSIAIAAAVSLALRSAPPHSASHGVQDAGAARPLTFAAQKEQVSR